MLVDQAQAMAQQYDIVVTNPPYMGASGMGEKLSQYVKVHYPNSKSDLFAVCMERGFDMLKPGGFESMITMESWMFLSSFEKMRLKINTTKTIIDLVHMPYLGKGGTSLGINFGTDMAIIRNQYIQGYVGIYDRIAYYETNDEGVPYDFPVKNKYYNETTQDNFSKIPGMPVAYWISPALLATYQNPSLSSISRPCKGIDTGDNSIFLRLWFEVDNNKMAYPSLSPIDSQVLYEYKWFPYNKGGEYRRWFGNADYLLDFEDNGKKIRAFSGSNLRNKDCYLNHGITWSSVTSGQPSMRYFDYGFFFDNGGSCLFADNHLMYILGFLNSTVATTILHIAPTLNTQPGDIGRLPIIIKDEMIPEVEQLVHDCVTLSRSDWNAFENSWGFAHHPLIRHLSTIAESYDQWKSECIDRFEKMKANEERLNRIFIDIYGLNTELVPDVNEDDVTVRLPDLGRDIRSLISFSVGCMFGRYSLDRDGLAFAGGKWTNSKYVSFIPDSDNCIPITDEAYFEDDIVGRFVDFIRIAYGTEALEDNLTFIANALGNKGGSSRETIRQYFLNEFFKDHCTMYSVSGSGKRPIYWLFDSGKQNGFKALVYMHRWNADTVGNLRVEYLHRMQRVYEKEIDRMQDIIDTSKENREVNQASKRREKLVKQLKEARDYDARIAHAALSRVEIDLDDGVKVNYEKVQKGPDGKSLGILAKI